jgi:3-methyladenine DNA glycosylase AlkD
VSALVPDVRAALRATGDPERARGMQAYLKTTEPCLGVRLPDVRRIVAEAVREHPPGSAAEVQAAAQALWREATVREERYAAVAVTGLPVARGVLDLLPLYEEMITTGAWWDLVDGIAGRIRDLLLAHPAQLRPVLVHWARSPDRWLRRSAIIAQLGAKDRTDRALLADVIETNAADPEFFVRKAIGWALRDLAKTDPAWVRRFAAAPSAAGKVSATRRVSSPFSTCSRSRSSASAFSA